jgi:hypothetical protein
MPGPVKILPSRCSLPDYLSGLPEIKRDMVKDIFSQAMTIFGSIPYRYRTSVPVPELRIIISDSLYAASAPGLMEISEGLVDHCLWNGFSLSEGIVEDEILRQKVDPNLLGSVMLTWVMAHEHFHVVRKNNEVVRINDEDEKKDPFDRMTEMAFELDADLCAIDEVYRLLKNTFKGQIPGISIRSLAIYSIFWALRTFPQENESTSFVSTHLSPEIRLLSFVLKLASINEKTGKGFHADVDLKLPETRDKIVVLHNVLIACEMEFRTRHPEPRKFGSFTFDIDKLMQEDPMGALEEWNRIQRLVEDVAHGESSK